TPDDNELYGQRLRAAAAKVLEDLGCEDTGHAIDIDPKIPLIASASRLRL
ncbi:hypothetical protein O988_04692, partial [Pseudogymnoascus sp. VKM F-3808]